VLCGVIPPSMFPSAAPLHVACAYAHVDPALVMTMLVLVCACVCGCDLWWRGRCR